MKKVSVFLKIQTLESKRKCSGYIPFSPESGDVGCAVSDFPKGFAAFDCDVLSSIK